MNADESGVETRELAGFSRVVLKDYGDLEIVLGTAESITIETTAEFLDKITTVVKNETLEIGIGANWLEKLQHAFSTSLSRTPIKYRLSAKSLNGVEVRGAARVKAAKLGNGSLALKISGAGRMTVDSLATGQLSVEISGTGTIDLEGQAQEQRIAISGAGNYGAADLASERASIMISGSGKATVKVSEELDVTVSGIGTVDYYGSAAVRKTISGAGRVNQLGK